MQLNRRPATKHREPSCSTIRRRAHRSTTIWHFMSRDKFSGPRGMDTPSALDKSGGSNGGKKRAGLGRRDGVSKTTGKDIKRRQHQQTWPRRRHLRSLVRPIVNRKKILQPTSVSLRMRLPVGPWQEMLHEETVHIEICNNFVTFLTF